MRLLPRSLYGRLAATALVTTLAALVFAGFAIGHVLERFVMQGLDARLDAQIAVVARAVRPDGSIDRAGIPNLPPFETPDSGWAWEIEGPNGSIRSASLGGDDLPLPPQRPPRPDGPPGPQADRAAPHPFDGSDSEGRRLHYRMLTLPGGTIIIAAGPRAIVEAPLRQAMVPLLLSLALLGIGLLAAMAVQLRIGLRPLGRLAQALGEVRAGRRRHLDPDQPSELAPLVGQMNALIDANEAGLARARRHVANLAHGIKTPLAALDVALAEPGRDPDGSLRVLAGRIDGSVRHHLGRARSAAGEGPVRATPVAARVADLIDVLARIHAERGIAAAVTIDPALAVLCDPQDIDEMLGNLLNNGWRWARSRVEVRAVREGPVVQLTIDDDGPGIAEDQIAVMLAPGARHDERPDSDGFGLSIARELAELHGGTLALGRASIGGLSVSLILAAAID